MCEALNLLYLLQENGKTPKTTDTSERKISSQGFETTKMCCHVLTEVQTRDTAFLIDKWFIQDFHTTVVRISWLLLLKPHFLTAEMNPEITKRKKRQTSIAEKSQHMQRQTHASPLYSSIPSWVSKIGSPQAQRRFSQFRKIQVYHFKETILQTFSNKIFNG